MRKINKKMYVLNSFMIYLYEKSKNKISFLNDSFYNLNFIQKIYNITIFNH